MEEAEVNQQRVLALLTDEREWARPWLWRAMPANWMAKQLGRSEGWVMAVMSGLRKAGLVEVEKKSNSPSFYRATVTAPVVSPPPEVTE